MSAGQSVEGVRDVTGHNSCVAAAALCIKAVYFMLSSELAKRCELQAQALRLNQPSKPRADPNSQTAAGIGIEWNPANEML